MGNECVEGGNWRECGDLREAGFLRSVALSASCAAADAMAAPLHSIYNSELLIHAKLSTNDVFATVANRQNISIRMVLEFLDVPKSSTLNPKSQYITVRL